MALKEQLSNDLKDAMRARDARRREVLRMAIASLHNAEIAAGKELDDEGVLGVLSTEAKRRRESIAEFGKAGRSDLVEKEEGELEVLQAYLPEQLSRDEIVAAAKRIIEQTGAAGMSDLGKVMPALMQELRGRADGRAANEVVRELLGS